VKFVRFAQWRIEETGYGVVGFVTNHGYLDNPTFRGMRQHLTRSFNHVCALDLHGSSRKDERSPGEAPDENVFDIQQGVAVSLLVKDLRASEQSRVLHADLWGARPAKSDWLAAKNVADTTWTELLPQPPFYLFIPHDTEAFAEYERAWPLPAAMPLGSMGMNTHRDRFVVGFTADELVARIGAFRDASHGEPAELEHRLSAERAAEAQALIRSYGETWRKHALPCLYRPFDFRHLYWCEALIDRPRSDANRHMFRPNMSLITTRQTREPFAALVADVVCGQHKIAAVYDGSSFFPLYLYPSQDEAKSGMYEPDQREPNLSPTFTADLAARLELAFVADGEGDLKQTFGPEDVFNYIYAVLHSPSYRERYAEFLKIDFPRIPLTRDVGLFRRLCRLGKQLVALHVMESPALDEPLAKFEAEGDNEVGKVRYDDNKQRVYINKKQYFSGVAPEVYEFQIGGYQVLNKWLKDRKGRTLSYDDIRHYCRVVVALKETMRVMQEIDDAIPEWPIA
jgi:predicted helicase